MLWNIWIGYGLICCFGAALTTEKTSIDSGTKPRAELEIIVENKPDGDLFRTEFLLKLIGDKQIPNLRMKVNLPTITRMEVTPHKSGVSISCQTEVREGFGFTNLHGAYGSYKVTFFSKSPDTMEVTLETR